MKGKTTCPQCKHEFVTDVPDSAERHTLSCPECQHSFTIKRICKDKSKEECGWEEHGEPRKTILSSLKQKTNRPVIASFLLLATGVLGIFTAVILGSSSEQFEFITSILLSINLDTVILSVLLTLFSAFAIIGSLTALLRKYYRVTLICAILGIFSIGLIIGVISALIALSLVIIARDEFEDGTKGKVF